MRRSIVRLGCAVIVVLTATAILASWGLKRWWDASPGDFADGMPPLGNDFEIENVRLPVQGPRQSQDLRSWLGPSRRGAIFLCDMRAISDVTAMAWATALGEALESRPAAIPRVVGVVEAPELPPLLRGPPTKMLAKFGSEFPFEMRLDFGGAVRKAFELPDGARGVVLLENDAVTARLIGELDDDDRRALRRFFALPERDELDSIDDPKRRLGVPALRDGVPVGVFFLGRRVTETEAPAFRSTPLGMLLAGFEPPADPSVRMVTFLAGAKGSTKNAEIVIVGALEGFPDRSWRRIADDPSLRATFGVSRQGPAIVVIDAAHAVRLRVDGAVPMWRLGAVAEWLGLEPPGS